MADPQADARRYAVRLERDVVSASGPESERYLQGQLSQDVASMTSGQSRWSWALSPNGKVDALLRVTRLSGEEWLLDTDGGWGASLLERLARFKLRSKVDLELTELQVLGLRGEGAAESVGTQSRVDLVAAADASWPGLPGIDLIGADPQPPEGWDLADAGRYESDRIAAGVPKLGAELTERTIPAETGLVGRTVSFDKGCYTGQELVARIDSRGGHVARHLRTLRSGSSITAGSDLFDGDRSVGTTTSAAPAHTGGGWVGLGYIHRSINVPATLTAGEVVVEVRELPQ